MVESDIEDRQESPGRFGRQRTPIMATPEGGNVDYLDICLIPLTNCLSRTMRTVKLNCLDWSIHIIGNMSEANLSLAFDKKAIAC